MIDLHCHLLPWIDDGPDTLEKALDLARLAVFNGITHAVVTPHIHPGRYENDASTIQLALERYRKALQTAGIPLKLGYAGEVRISAEVLEMVDRDEIPFYGELAGYKVFLLEFPHSHVPLGSESLVRWLLDQKIRPMIAHPERNRDVMRDINKIQPFIEMGCLLQLTAGSVAGMFGAPAQRMARLLLETGRVTLLASDAHNCEFRPPRLDHGRAAAAQVVGEELATRMVQHRPWALVAHQFNQLQQEEEHADTF